MNVTISAFWNSPFSLNTRSCRMLWNRMSQTANLSILKCTELLKLGLVQMCLKLHDKDAKLFITNFAIILRNMSLIQPGSFVLIAFGWTCACSFRLPIGIAYRLPGEHRGRLHWMRLHRSSTSSRWISNYCKNPLSNPVLVVCGLRINVHVHFDWEFPRVFRRMEDTRTFSSHQCREEDLWTVMVS